MVFLSVATQSNAKLKYFRLWRKRNESKSKRTRILLILRRVSLQEKSFGHLRSTMKQDRLNNCLLMHCHKPITDTLETVKIAKRFACANELRKGHFGKFE